MGRSFTPKYVVETFYEKENITREFPMEWRTAKRGQLTGYGKPTPDNLARFVAKFNDSMKPGGCNERLRPLTGYVEAAQIRENSPNGETVARFAYAGFNLNRFIP